MDDSSPMRRAIKNMLRDLGRTNTEEADGGTTALPMLESGHFDFLITGWDMPGMNGADLVRKIRADDQLKGIRVLAVSSDVKGDEATQAGASSHITKPFTADALKDEIEKIFAGG
ncbi:response regulator [Streptomyces xanthophaeus]